MGLILLNVAATGAIVEYAMTNAGFTAALAAAAAGDIIKLPAGTLNGNQTIPVDIAIIGSGVNTKLTGVITINHAGGTGYLANLTLGTAYIVHLQEWGTGAHKSLQMSAGALWGVNTPASANADLTIFQDLLVGPTTGPGVSYIDITNFGGGYVKIGRSVDAVDAVVRYVSNNTNQWDAGLFSDGVDRRWRLKSLSGDGVLYFEHDGDLQFSGNLKMGVGAAGVDYSITVDGETNDGSLSWMEDEDYWRFDDDLAMQDGENLIFATSTGSKIGTAADQKIGFWNAAPIVQPTTGVAAAAFVQNGGNAINDASTLDGYTLLQVVKALRNVGMLA
jgi:hypothetical protein